MSERPNLHLVHLVQPDEEAERHVELPDEHDAETATDQTEIITGRPVDQPETDEPPLPVYATITGRNNDNRRPILPVWVKSRDDLEAGIRWWADRVWYRVRWHAWKSPKYAARILRWSPAGAWNLTQVAWRWASDDATEQRANAAPSPDVMLKLLSRADKRRKVRMPVFFTGLAGAVSGTYALAVYGPWQLHLLAAAASLPALARAGRPADRPITEVSVSITRHQRLTAERVRDALCVLGIPGLKDPKKITFPMEIHRDGPGQLARVNLPHGVEAVEVCDKRGKLSSALRLPVDQVWPTGGPDHEGQLDLWVGYQPASKMKPPKWSLAADGARTSVFEPVEFGADQRQRPVATVLFARNWLIGGVPGSGKSYFARALALAAALDPTTEFKIAEFKGTADFADFDEAGLCSDYYCGVDDEALEGGASIIAWGLAEAERRGKRIRKYRAQGRAPEGKVTPELAAEPGSGLHPVVILIDEAHELLVDPEVAAAAERLIKRGRALGLIVILATQIPDAKSVPPIITRCVTMRACLAVQDHIANDMILGTGSYRRGVTATAYRPGLDAGWGMVTGLEAPTAVRSQFPDEATAKKILARAKQLRGGVMPGSVEEAPRLDILVDVVRVWPGTRTGVHWQHLAELLAEARPEAYGDVTAESVSALLRGLDVPSENVKVDGQVLKGCKRTAVEAALERRELPRG